MLLANSLFLYFRRRVFQNVPDGEMRCKRPIKMSPLCQLQMTLSVGVSGVTVGWSRSPPRQREYRGAGEEDRFAADSSLEGGGFELPVPRKEGVIARDPAFFEGHRFLYQQQPLPVREEAGRVRSVELRDFMASGLFFQSLSQVLSPLADEAPGRLDGIMFILCAEIVHRRIWDETMKRNPHTPDFFKNILG
jgi:hypothetical protein